MSIKYLSMPICFKDKEYITQEMWELWSDILGKIGAYHVCSHAIYYHVSDEDYYNQDGPPPPINKDIVCIISYTDHKVNYSFKNKNYSSIKDYICTLKNIAFL